MSTRLLLLVLAGALGCSSESSTPSTGVDGGVDAGPAAPSTVSGKITLPADATGRCVMIALDDDTTGSNGTARRDDGNYLLSYRVVPGRDVSFSFDRVPSGSYFLWAFVDVDSSSSAPPGDCEMQGGPNGGDHFGYYGTGFGPPDVPNVRIPGAGSAYDFQLGVFP